MSVTFRRLFAVLVGLWAIRHVLATLALPPEVQLLWGVGAFLWIVAAIYLFIGRHVQIVSWSVLALIGLEFMVSGLWNREGLSMLAWLAFIVGVTEGRPTERALLLRMLATVVYFFGAVTKINPSWLAGEGLIALPAQHPPLAWAAGALSDPGVAATAAVCVILLELLVPTGLWSRRLRPYAAAVGMLLHVSFVATLARTPFSLLHLVMLNGGLVLCYLAFWYPIDVEAAEEAESGTPRTHLRARLPIGITQRAAGPGRHTAAVPAVTAARKSS